MAIGGEVFLGAFLQVLFERLASLASPSLVDFVNRFRGISSKQIKNWKRKLRTLERFLVDAEQRQLTDSDVKKWLDDLRDLFYDLEDLLDDYQSESSNMMQSCFPSCFSNFKFHDCVKNINSRLDDLCEQKEELQLVQIGGDTSSLAISAADRPPSTSLLSEVAVLGRDDDKRRMLDMVMRDDSGRSGISFQVISIVGMGGIGKTTLAQAVYNDESLMGEFSVKAWVCISQDFDVLRISKAILGAVTSLSSDLPDLDQVHRKLQEHMAGKKFLLVLDDVWNYDYDLWDKLKPPFRAAAPGSKIIVTTRYRDVAKTMGSIELKYLECLSDDDCWELFCRHANNLNGNTDSVRDLVVKRCKGLPLAAKALGGLLRSKPRQKWEDVLDSEIWELLPDRCNILPVLRLSYQHLPSHLKRCFAYCAILPEDYEFEEQELVLLWMAEGFIHESKRNKQMEDLGREYFADLVSRSFFQQSRSGSSKYIMHDLVNDLAKWASGDTCFRLEDKMKFEMQGKKIKNIRHSSFIGRYCDGKNRFEIFHEAERLRTFLPFSSTFGHKFISNTVVFDLLPKLKRLRVLSLQGYAVFELPDSIGDLKHMRYFNLTGTMIRSIPESISRLLNLETLLLRNCSKLLKLPAGLGELINLRYLDIKGANSISEMPLGMENLKSLRTLSNFVVGKDACSILTALKNLELRNEEFCISKLENVDRTKDLVLNKMVGLKALVLKWNSGGRSRDEKIDKNVLNVLQPHTNLEELTINSYHGKGFSAWLGSSLFTKMKVLELNGCGNCTSLPSLGQLCSLKQIKISNMQNLKSIGPLVFGGALEILCLHLLPECELWEQIQEIEREQKFTHLRKLSISDCTNLSGKLPPNLPSLEELDIRNCPQLVVSLSNLSTICTLKIDGCKKVVCSCPLDSKPLECLTLSSISEVENCLIRGIQKVRLLEIKGTNCEQVINFWGQDEPAARNPVQGFQAPICVSELCINGNCPNLCSIPEVRFLPTLTKLEIKGCSALTSLGEEVLKHNLESLEVEDCDSLKFIARGTIPRCLRRLTIQNCKSLQCVFDDGEAGSTSNSLSDVVSEYLIELKITECNALTSLAEVLKHNLESLQVEYCHSLKFIARGTIPRCLRRLTIWNCKSMQCVFDDGEVGSTSNSLSNTAKSVPEYLDISGCESLLCLSSRGLLAAGLKHLEIGSCSELTTLSSQLPKELQELQIFSCPKLESIAESLHDNTSLETIDIEDCENLKSIPDGLHDMRRLQSISIRSCENLDSFPREGLPDIVLNLVISECEKLQTLPNRIHMLSALQGLTITGCPRITSFPEEGFPNNLSDLVIGASLSIFKQMIQWMQNLTSFRKLFIDGDGCEAVSFPEEDMPMMFPASLTHLGIFRFQKLEHLSFGIENLTSLESLWIVDCPNLVSFSKGTLPSSLLSLWIASCPLLSKRCERGKGQEWHKIAHIPRIET